MFPAYIPYYTPYYLTLHLGGAGPVTSGYITIVIGMRYISPCGGCYQGYIYQLITPIAPPSIPYIPVYTTVIHCALW